MTYYTLLKNGKIKKVRTIVPPTYGQRIMDLAIRIKLHPNQLPGKRAAIIKELKELVEERNRVAEEITAGIRPISDYDEYLV